MIGRVTGDLPVCKLKVRGQAVHWTLCPLPLFRVHILRPTPFCHANLRLPGHPLAPPFAGLYHEGLTAARTLIVQCLPASACTYAQEPSRSTERLAWPAILAAHPISSQRDWVRSFGWTCCTNCSFRGRLTTASRWGLSAGDARAMWPQCDPMRPHWSIVKAASLSSLLIVSRGTISIKLMSCGPTRARLA
jgi:hypothetical protein